LPRGSLAGDGDKAGTRAGGLDLAARGGNVVLHRGFGRITPMEGSRAAGPDTVYLLASITKPVAACALMLLVERGMVALDDPVRTPSGCGGDRRRAYSRYAFHLQRRRTPGAKPRRARFWFVRQAMTTPLSSRAPIFRYQSMGVLLAGEIVERVSGKRAGVLKQRCSIHSECGTARLGLGRFKIEHGMVPTAGSFGRSRALRSE
jgi:CubicO group peptidase (beta-lactamase class C family)